MARLKDRLWNMHGSELNSPYPMDTIKVNVLMDLRDELKELNLNMARIASVLGCRNFTSLPANVRGIRKLLAEPPPPRRRKVT